MTRGQALGDLLIVGAVVVVPQVMAGLTGGQPTKGEASSISPEMMVLANALQFGLMATVGMYLTYRAGQPLSSMGFRRARFWPTIRSAVATTVIMYGALLVLAALGAALVRPEYETMTQPMREIEGLLGVPSWSMIFLLAGSAGVFEEILFRGFLLTRLRVLMGSWGVAIAAGMVVFALPHLWQGWWAVMLILPVALVLSVVFVRQRSLAVPIMAHFLFNFLQLGLLRLIADSPHLQELMQEG